MKNTKNTKLSATLAAAALALSAGSACDPQPPPGRDEREQREEPEAEPLFEVSAVATADSSVVEETSDLNAYLYWTDDGTGTRAPAIDRVAVGTSLPASFSLSIASAPGADEEYPGLPGVSAAILFVTSEENAESLRDQTTASLPPGSVFGVSDVFIIHLADETAAALMLENTGLALPTGFSLVGPNPESYACVTDAFSQADACRNTKFAECDAQAFDGETFDDAAWNACMEGACAAEDAQATEVAALCPPNMKQLPQDTQLAVQLQVVPESDVIVDEE